MSELSSRPTPEERFVTAYHSCFPAVARFIRRRVGVGGEQEVLAETFLAAWRHIDQLPDEPLPWLFRIARFEVANHVRGQDRRAELLNRLPVSSENAGDIAESAVEQDALLRAFARLSPVDQETLRLVSWDGLSAHDAAAAMGRTLANFRVQLHRARKRLTRALETEEQDDEAASDLASGSPSAALHIQAPTALEACEPRLI